MAHDAAPTVTRNDERNRYEIHVDGAVAGYTLITTDDAGRTVMPHTKIDPAYKGRGLGRILVSEALADLAGRDAEVVPTCPFVAGYLAENDVPGLTVASPDTE
ncbi:GNAT family N-acetyltransferase [Microbacterium oleivorans]|uniref:GNAT family N-acetyltransferase n=1 Tax=Microbacterium oleivorans TaxID=273677 RepID=UPI00203B1B38|nr:GNAT family N-acetyltransferase [Microbacterium oleivorans]MCM3695121.1 N-acetyltransferase [Microbacterium oleivorans]